MLQLGFTSVSRAAEIPPTAECVSTYKTLYAAYIDETWDGVTDKQERQAERRFAQGLADTGCISDAEPLLKEMPPKPFTAECSAAAAAADDFWSGPSERFNALYRSYRRVIRPYNRRVSKINSRIGRLRERGGERRKVKRLVRQKRSIRKAGSRRTTPIEKKAMRIAAEIAYPVNLALVELFSLRCVGGDLYGNGKPKGPASRTVRRNSSLIFSSSVLVYVRTVREHADEASASSASPVRLRLLEMKGDDGGPIPGQSIVLP